MIEYMAFSGTDDALNCPIFICDYCRKQITGPGNIVWGEAGGHPEGEPRRRTPLFATHKDCDHKFTAMFRQIYPPEGGWRDLWDDIDTFLRQLAHNATHALDEKAGEAHPHIMDMPLVRNWGQQPDEGGSGAR
ncbi:hypothetical protein ACFW81_23790 [Streptomyces angustmyceticus]|uniref:hypothetical protein n=1 Tax=Streptomyces angustmyceticus TaxID=285578 RepID=UPI0036775D51